ncbi:MAG: hypothetical protein GX053_15395 [Tissierella sp.]|nr:hypothetical protein [Tissierella sp.]
MNSYVTLVKFEQLEKINELFSRGKAYIAYHGENRNNSFILKRTFDDAIPTLYGIPIVGEYIYERDNFGGHGGKIEKTDDDIRFIHTTKPIGFVPESAQVSWEEVTEKDGSINQYLVVDGIILWTGRYPEAEMIKERPYGQSMEIEVLDGEFAEINGKEIYVINKFIFSALCVLGVNKESDPDGHVEPCFESAKIIAYQLDKDKFKKEFAKMIKEFKQFTLEGGDSSLGKFGNDDNKNNHSVDNSGRGVDGNMKFSKEDICNLLHQEKMTVSYMEDVTAEVARFLYSGHDDQFVFAFDRKNDYNVKIPYSSEEEKLVINFEEAKKVKIVYQDWEDGAEDYSLVNEVVESVVGAFESVFESLNNKLSKMQEEITSKEETVFSLDKKYRELQKKFDQAQTELQELKEYKLNTEQKIREEKIESVFAKYKEHLSEDEIMNFKDKVSEFEKIEDFEKEIKSFAFDKIAEKLKNSNSQFINIGLPKNMDDINNSSGDQEPQNVFDRLEKKLKK